MFEATLFHVPPELVFPPRTGKPRPRMPQPSGHVHQNPKLCLWEYVSSGGQKTLLHPLPPATLFLKEMQLEKISSFPHYHILWRGWSVFFLPNNVYSHAIVIYFFFLSVVCLGESLGNSRSSGLEKTRVLFQILLRGTFGFSKENRAQEEVWQWHCILTAFFHL